MVADRVILPAIPVPERQRAEKFVSDETMGSAVAIELDDLLLSDAIMFSIVKGCLTVVVFWQVVPEFEETFTGSETVPEAIRFAPVAPGIPYIRLSFAWYWMYVAVSTAGDVCARA